MSKFLEAAKLTMQMVGEQDLAEAAADGKGRGESFQMTVRDKYDREIIVGHMLVVVLYGSEQHMETALEALLEVSSIVRAGEINLNGGEQR